MKGKVLAAVGLGALAVVAWAYLRPTTLERVRDVEATLRERGELVSLRDLEPPPPGATNGAPILEDALAWLNDTLRDDEGWSDRTIGPWNTSARTTIDQATTDELAKTDAFLRRLAPYFDFVTRAIECDEIAWPLGEPDEGGYGVPGAAYVREAQHFLTARAYAARTPTERLAGIRDSLVLTRRLRVRTQMEQLQAAIYASFTCRNLYEALARGAVDPQVALAELEPLLRDSYRAKIPHMLRRRRAELIDLAPIWIEERARRAKEDGGSFRDDVEGLVRNLRKGRFGPRDLLAIDSLPDGLLAMDALFDLDPLDGAATEEALWQFALEHRGAFLLLPRIAEILYRVDCQTALARVALAACRFQQLHGDWPSSSGDLRDLFTDGVPLDPYTGEPFVFEVRGGVLVIAPSPGADVRLPEPTLYESGLEVRLPAR